MKICLLMSPYDSGFYGERMGAGPLRLLDSGLDAALQMDGHETQTVWLHSDLKFNGEIATAFALHRSGAAAARSAMSDGAFPILLAGNCNASIGPIIGMEADGVVWFDTHGDFNTPENTASGFFDGMGMAVLAGQCFRSLAMRTPGFRPFSGGQLIHVGGRDFDSGELDNLMDAGVQIASADDVRADAAGAWMRPLAGRRVHLHFDVDVLDPSVGAANSFTAIPGGLSLSDAVDAIRTVRREAVLVSATFSSYEPAVDPDGAMVQTIVEIVRQTVAD
ncbi:MAG: arginase family protein [Chloroflexi bacterium]|nr:arginase family protein [Chloroflexota bacterium]